MILLLVVGYLMILMVIGAAVTRLMLPVFGRGWRLFVAPGIILHELAHALACAATGAEVREINFWKVSGGHVLHGPPRLHLIGPVLISLAPMLMMTAGLFALAPLVADSLAALPWTQTVPKTVTEFLGGYTVTILDAFRSLDWSTFKPWLLVYGMLNVAVTITPSTIDLHNAKWAFVGVAILAALLTQLLAIDVPLDFLWPPIATSLVLLGMAVVAASLVRSIVVGVRRIRPEMRTVLRSR